MGGRGTVRKQINDSPACLQKLTLAENIYHGKKPQELLPIALHCDEAARPPGCGEVSVETRSQKKSLFI